MITAYNNMLNGNGRAMMERFFMMKYFRDEWEEECDAREERNDEDVKETMQDLAQQKFNEINNLVDPDDPDDFIFSFWVPH